jgi:sulfoxide reductase heme-binding subunit YedZ
MSDTSLSDPSQHLFWLASRALGIVAVLLLSASVACGLALSGRMSERPGGAARLKTLHEALTLTALGAIAGHGLALLGDTYLSPGLSGIAVPFVLGFKQLWTGLGVVGGWLAAILGLSYYARRWIGPRRWRKLHRWTLLAYVPAVAHTIGSGTDASSAWLLLLTAAVGLPAVGLALRRLTDDRGQGRPIGSRA